MQDLTCAVAELNVRDRLKSQRNPRSHRSRRRLCGDNCAHRGINLAVVRVQSRGQVTLPSEVRRIARVNAGDFVKIEVLGSGRLELTVLPKLSPRELRSRYPVEAPIREAEDRAAWEAAAAETVIRD